MSTIENWMPDSSFVSSSECVTSSWEIVSLGSCIKSIEAGKSFKCDERPPQDGEIGVVKISAVTWGEYAEEESKTCTNDLLVNDRLFIKNGDFLISRANTIELVGSCVIAKNVTKKVMLSDKVLRITFNGMLPKFALYFLRSRQGRSQIEALSTGNQESMRNIGQERIRSIKIPFPPIDVQQRVVENIEMLLSELDKGIEQLKTAREQLKVYRQAVLKHAFEGKLTAQWREENKDKLESPEQLLARIQQEREARYQQQLREWQAAVKEWEKDGKEGRKPGKPIKPKALPSLKEVEIEQLDELPIDWMWVRVGDVASVGTGITPLKSNMSFYADGDVPWVTSGALNDSFVREPSSYVTTKALNETNLRLYPPNTLVVALYGEGKTRGKCSELLIEAATNQAIAAIVLGGVAKGFRRFLKWFLTKNYEAMRLGSSGGVQPNLNLGIIEAMAVPFCSLSESIELAEILDAEFSRIERMESDLVSQIKRAEILRQSILKQAFSGQLVRQDPNDEPASTLFERIFAEKAAEIPVKRGRRTA